MPTSARTRRRRGRSAKALRHRHQADARCAPLRRNRGPDAFGESALTELPGGRLIAAPAVGTGNCVGQLSCAAQISLEITQALW